MLDFASPSGLAAVAAILSAAVVAQPGPEGSSSIDPDPLAMRRRPSAGRDAALVMPGDEPGRTPAAGARPGRGRCGRPRASGRWWPGR